jgi:hypothetical protein
MGKKLTSERQRKFRAEYQNYRSNEVASIGFGSWRDLEAVNLKVSCTMNNV